MADLSVKVEEAKGSPGTSLVILDGPIDAKTVVSFQTQMNTVKERGAKRFVIDMDKVTYVNSTGLGYLINLVDTIGPVALVKIQPKVKSLFEMMGVDSFFKLTGSREEALKLLGADGVPATAAPAAPAPVPPPAQPVRPPEPPRAAAPAAPPPAPAPAAAPGQRMVNAWFVGYPTAVVVGRPVPLAFAVGTARPKCVASIPLTEPKWADAATGTVLKVSLAAEGADVEPGLYPLGLPRKGSTFTVVFGLVPRKAGPMGIRLALQTLKEGTLVQEVRAVVNVSPGP